MPASMFLCSCCSSPMLAKQDRVGGAGTGVLMVKKSKKPAPIRPSH